MGFHDDASLNEPDLDALIADLRTLPPLPSEQDE